jgi:hypothetical protein
MFENQLISGFGRLWKGKVRLLQKREDSERGSHLKGHLKGDLGERKQFAAKDGQ